MFDFLFDNRFAMTGRVLAALLYPIYAVLALMSLPVNLVHIIAASLAERSYFGEPDVGTFHEVLRECRWVLIARYDIAVDNILYQVACR